MLRPVHEDDYRNDYFPEENQEENTENLTDSSEGSDYIIADNLFENVNNNMDKIQNGFVKEFLLKFIKIFQDTIWEKTRNDASYFFPPIKMIVEENDSVFLDWIFKDYRIGFAIETRISESSWYLVANENLDNFSMYGKLEIDTIRYILDEKLLPFVIGNS
jgi:hypothetical protein